MAEQVQNTFLDDSAIYPTRHAIVSRRSVPELMNTPGDTEKWTCPNRGYGGDSPSDVDYAELCEEDGDATKSDLCVPSWSFDDPVEKLSERKTSILRPRTGKQRFKAIVHNHVGQACEEPKRPNDLSSKWGPGMGYYIPKSSEDPEWKRQTGRNAR